MNDDNTIISKQIPRQAQPRIRHIEAISMEAPTRLAIFFIRRNPMPLSIDLPRDAFIVLNIIAKIVLVDKITARVVGWIDNHTNFDTT